MNRSINRLGGWFVALGFGFASVTSIGPVQAQEMCGGQSYPFPYTDVSGVGAAFCPGIMEAYVTGISKGTSPTTFSPNEDVPRLQMTTFLQRTVDQVITRGNRRAAFNQWWTPQNTNAMQAINVTGTPEFCAADGEAIWVTDSGGVEQVRATDGAVLSGWEAPNSMGVLVALGRVFVTGYTSPGYLELIDVPGSSTTTVSLSLGNNPVGIAFDGAKLWTANVGPPGSVSIITPQASTPYPVTTVTTGFAEPYGILYDGRHIWVTDYNAGNLLQLDASGNILQRVTVGKNPETAVFDGVNIWVPNQGSNSITVVQASTGNVVATITQDGTNMLSEPSGASFDGERVLVTNAGNFSVTVFKAADLSVIANILISATAYTACSDGINFWLPLNDTGDLLRF